MFYWFLLFSWFLLHFPRIFVCKGRVPPANIHQVAGKSLVSLSYQATRLMAQERFGEGQCVLTKFSALDSLDRWIGSCSVASLPLSEDTQLNRLNISLTHRIPCFPGFVEVHCWLNWELLNSVHYPLTVVFSYQGTAWAHQRYRWWTSAERWPKLTGQGSWQQWAFVGALIRFSINSSPASGSNVLMF